MSTASVIAEIIIEREAQPGKGFTIVQDDLCTDGSIAAAASLYAHPAPPMYSDPRITHPIGWPREWAYNPKDRRANLIRASAMLVAEIERLDRL
jgi:hypothetical protein